MHPILRPDWHLPDAAATPEGVYRNRRQFVKQLGLGLAVLPFWTPQGEDKGPLSTIPANAPRRGYPARRNPRYTVPERPTTGRLIASSYNNYYEFLNTGNLKEVWPLTVRYEPFPNRLRVGGLVRKPFELDTAELIASMPLEERLYRFRCVEGWAMTVPWTGFPLRKLIERCAPLSKATHVRIRSTSRPEEMPGVRIARAYPWPYYEGLRLDEAMNELAFVAVGMYGEPLPKQSGSPMRIILPWKYGFKGPKAVQEIEFLAKRPETFWTRTNPREYGFLSNVNPNIPHPRWSQANERLLEGETVPTQIFNGYGAFVGGLYPDEPRKLTAIVR